MHLGGRSDQKGRRPPERTKDNASSVVCSFSFHFIFFSREVVVPRYLRALSCDVAASDVRVGAIAASNERVAKAPEHFGTSSTFLRCSRQKRNATKKGFGQIRRKGTRANLPSNTDTGRRHTQHAWPWRNRKRCLVSPQQRLGSDGRRDMLQ
ncbi:unnamed protein product [Ixodes pacificus]